MEERPFVRLQGRPVRCTGFPIKPRRLVQQESLYSQPQAEPDPRGYFPPNPKRINVNGQTANLKLMHRKVTFYNIPTFYFLINILH